MITKTCLQCGEVFPTYPYNVRIGKGLFCSRSCASKSHTGERNNRWVGRVEKICPQCGTVFPSYECHNQKFCSPECHYTSRRGVELKRPEDKYMGNPKNRFARGVSAYISLSLRNGKQGYSWEKLVGYTAADLVAHLESQFEKGMTWENYGRGGWHVDHIRPVRDFEFASPNDEEFKQCWSLWNLQPMWESENVRKGAKCEAPPLPLVNQG